jgi:apolipoprotein N-acyltransferase
LGVFSWSTRHLGYGVWALFPLIGGLYPLLTWTLYRRLLTVVPAGLGLGLALAASEWARSVMPGINYPHNQLSHGLYASPALLAGAAWWGEVGMNFCVAASSGLAVDVLVRWRNGRPSRAWCGFGTVGVGMMFLVPVLVDARAEGPAGRTAVRMAVVQPGWPTDSVAEWLRILVTGTLESLNRLPRAEADLVLWPESSLVPGWQDAEGGLTPMARVLRTTLPPQTCLLTAGALRRGAGEKFVAVLVDRDGRLLGSSEKEILVPGGETVFFLDWLPATWRISILQRLRELSPALAPAVFGGDHSPLLQLPGGTRFAAPICFENAFAAFCARRTAEGASSSVC